MGTNRNSMADLLRTVLSANEGWMAVLRLGVSAAMLTGLVGLGCLAIILAPMRSGSYLAAAADKQARLQDTASPKLVFLGGSNLSFGVDSPGLEERLGYPVVNMGLGMNMGLRFMLDSVQPHLHSGDVAIVSPEYQMFFGLYNGDDELFEVLDAFPEGYRFIRSPAQIYRLVERSPTHLKRKFNRMMNALFGRKSSTDCLYCRSAFNEYGDLDLHLDKERSDISQMPLLREQERGVPVDPQAIAGVNDFYRTAAAKGVRVFFMYPPVPEPMYQEDREQVEDLHARLSEELEAPILGPPASHTYPIEYFFDWVYHLTGEGRDIRTADFVARLGPILDRGRAAGR